MPLKPGNSKTDIGFNIRELVDSGKQKGQIGNGPPKKGPALQKQAVAVALQKAGKSTR